MHQRLFRTGLRAARSFPDCAYIFEYSDVIYKYTVREAAAFQQVQRGLPMQVYAYAPLCIRTHVLRDALVSE